MIKLFIDRIKNRDLQIYTLFLILVLLVSMVNAQTQEVGKMTLTRGKMWFCGLPNGSLEKESSMDYTWQCMYPGHWSARNEVSGGWDRTRIFNGAVLGTEEVGWQYRNQRTGSDIYAINQTEHIRNYNLVDPTKPEESMQGVFGSFQYDNANKRHMHYEIEGEVMVWSLPKYDDFVLIKCRLTNTDDIAFNDFYYARYLEPKGPYNPLGTNYDVEYMWDSEISDDVGFVFYDDTEWSPTAPDSTIYDEFPGTITGDRGDPGNIKTQNSLDSALYSPSVYAFTFTNISPNKNGEKKVWRNIYSGSGSAPAEDDFPGTDILATYAGLKEAMSDNQPELSWDEAWAQYQVGAYGGSLWERSPRYLYGIGPYDIAPGESIEWVEVFICGAMDRNVTIKGGLQATRNFVREGLINMKENWSAAKELIDNNYAVLADMPPPTPADVPSNTTDLENSNFLKAESSSKVVGGTEVAGIELRWNAVHENYTDPITGVDDFYGYIVYRSNISVEGPWVSVDTITIAEAVGLTDGGEVTYFMEAGINIPWLYLVTSIDEDGNESARTAYTHYTVEAKTFATNRMESIMVIPNPFRQESGLMNPAEVKRMVFLNIPEKCVIRIYTMNLDLVRVLKHDGGGEEAWGSTQGQDYMLSDFAMNVSPGVYIYHVENLVEGHKGDTQVGKIVIIK